ncbi:hypothetical protein BU24DRAFT_361523 [Aaosphaeria arxii CBS 175.79]|uniref:TPR domain-containing protein n=1 Tax=Aaosphaeria arxii CBS 175.79 TaxID=1450172 RepID=A0A6A5Y7I0_9PLEO|nr:uncharacterized protein BU24DRAFT_361523 [Aaosphaeria arxii CBS 175.79]KAF2020957.1 hypothetical protein BU24DRAFT_361523 [Aaosphaeria arxii CBS 175.79]
MFSRTVPRALPRLSRVVQCETQPQVATFTKIPSRTWRPLQQQCSKRPASTLARQFKEQYNRSPILFPFALGCVLLVATGAIIYVPWYYQNIIIKPYHNFPEPVAKKLRRAIFYSRGKNIDLKEANKYFRQALALANEHGMDPFGPEILGVKYAISNLFEQAGHFPLACDVLEIMRVDCNRWIEEFSDKHWTNGNRSRILKVTVQLNVKLAELYDSKYMNQPDDAEKRLVEAVETVLRETTRRRNEGVKEGEGDFMTDEEVGGTMEALGNHYEKFDSHYLATPLFLQALALCPPTSCHGVVLMNNISTCLAQQTPPPASSAPPTADSFPNTPPTPRSALVDQARQWATKAIERASMIAPPDRNEECDVGCTVATHNLGEFFEMEGKIKEARQRYDEAASLAKAIGFEEGRVNAKAGLQRLKALEKAA